MDPKTVVKYMVGVDFDWIVNLCEHLFDIIKIVMLFNRIVIQRKLYSIFGLNYLQHLTIILPHISCDASENEIGIHFIRKFMIKKQPAINVVCITRTRQTKYVR